MMEKTQQVNLSDLPVEDAAKSLLSEQLVEGGMDPASAIEQTEAWFNGEIKTPDHPVLDAVSYLTSIVEVLKAPTPEVEETTAMEDTVKAIDMLPFTENLRDEASLRVMQMISKQAPDRLLDSEGVGHHINSTKGQELMKKLFVVMVRNDGWTLGCTRASVIQADQLYADDWVGVVSDGGAKIEPFQEWRRSHPLELMEGIGFDADAIV